MFQEWTASNGPDAKLHNFFEAELARPVRLSVPARRSLNRFVADGAHRTRLVRGAVRAREADVQDDSQDDVQAEDVEAEVGDAAAAAAAAEQDDTAYDT